MRNTFNIWNYKWWILYSPSHLLCSYTFKMIWRFGCCSLTTQKIFITFFFSLNNYNNFDKLVIFLIVRIDVYGFIIHNTLVLIITIRLYCNKMQQYVSLMCDSTLSWNEALWFEEYVVLSRQVSKKIIKLLTLSFIKLCSPNLSIFNIKNVRCSIRSLYQFRKASKCIWSILAATSNM